MQQSALTIAVPIDPKQLEGPASWSSCEERVIQLREQLVAARAVAGIAVAGIDVAGIDVAAELRALLAAPADGGAGIHSFSFCALAPVAEGPGYLVLELIGDGSPGELRRLLTSAAPAFLLELFGASPELAAGARTLPGFLSRHSLTGQVFYAAAPGRSVGQIDAEQGLRREVRGRHRAAGSPPPSGVCPRASGSTSLRLSPTSASAAWRALRDAFAERALVREGHRRSLQERWNLGNGGLRERLEHWGPRLRSAFALVAAVLGLLLLCRDERLASVREPFALGALGVSVLVLAAIALIIWREGPRSLKLPGHWLVLRGMLSEQLGALYSLGIGFGSLALVGSVVARLPWTQSAVGALLLGALWLGLSAARFAELGGAAVSAVLVAAALLPPEWLPLIPAGALGALCAGLAAALLALVYVMLGRAALGLALVLGGSAAAAHLWWHTRSHPLGAGDLLGMSAIGAAALLALLGLGALWVARWLIAVRALERQEALAQSTARAARPASEPEPSAAEPSELSAGSTALEHLTLVSRLELGALRRSTLRRVLRALELAVFARLGCGDSGGAGGVRFARFVLLPDGQRLLASCECDGGLAARAGALGGLPLVTAVFSNCVGFPAGYFLTGDGARDARRFRAFAQADRVATLGWHAAHAELSVRDIQAAAQIRRDLQRPLDDPMSWQGRWRRRFGEPLSEADCDLALRLLSTVPATVSHTAASRA